MTTVNKQKILKNLPIFLSAGLILAAGFVFVHFSAKNKNPGQGEVLGQNTLTQTTAQTSPSENTAYGEKSAALQPTPAPESAADQQANKPNAALPNAEKKPDVEHELIPGDPLIRGGGGTGSTNFRGGSGGGGGGSGTISFDTSSGNTQTTGSSLTWQHTVATGGVLFVSCSSMGDSPTVTGVTYNGVAMTQLWNTNLSGSGVFAQSSGWLMVNPATGSAHDIVCTLSGTSGGYIAGAATSWTGVETSSVAAAHRTVFTRGDGDGSPAITITDSQNGDVIVAGIGNFGTNPVPADSPRVTQNNIDGGAYDHNHESLAATGANAVIDYTGSQFYTMGATALVPAAGSGTGGNVKFR